MSKQTKPKKKKAWKQLQLWRLGSFRPLLASLYKSRPEHKDQEGGIKEVKPELE